MSDKTTSLLLLCGSAVGLFLYGTFLLRRMADTVLDGSSEGRPLILWPFAAPQLVARYRSLWEAAPEDAPLPRLHRSLRLHQVLLVGLMLATIGRLLTQ